MCGLCIGTDEQKGKTEQQDMIRKSPKYSDSQLLKR